MNPNVSFCRLQHWQVWVWRCPTPPDVKCFKVALKGLNMSVRQADISYVVRFNVVAQRHIGAITPVTAKLRDSPTATWLIRTTGYSVKNKGRAGGKKKNKIKITFQQWWCGSPAESISTFMYPSISPSLLNVGGCCRGPQLLTDPPTPLLQTHRRKTVCFSFWDWPSTGQDSTAMWDIITTKLYYEAEFNLFIFI